MNLQTFNAGINSSRAMTPSQRENRMYIIKGNLITFNGSVVNVYVTADGVSLHQRDARRYDNAGDAVADCAHGFRVVSLVPKRYTDD